MERAGVPANFIVKLKSQQSQLLRSMFRVNYIRKVFIHSTTFLVRSIVVLVIGLLLLTNVDPFYGSLVIVELLRLSWYTC